MHTIVQDLAARTSAEDSLAAVWKKQNCCGRESSDCKLYELLYRMNPQPAQAGFRETKQRGVTKARKLGCWLLEFPDTRISA